MQIQNKTLHEIIAMIIDLYCNNQRMPLIHFCVDLDGINSQFSFTITHNDNTNGLVSLIELIETVRSLSEEEKNKLVGYIFIEFKSFLVANKGPLYRTTFDTYQDHRLWIDNFPSQNWLNSGLEFSPDTGDYGFTRYNITYSGDNYIDPSHSCTVSFGPQGIAYGDPENITPEVQDWANDYPDDHTLVRTYSQRTRVSYRVHIIACTSDMLVLDHCQANVLESKYDEPKPELPPITNNEYIMCFIDEAVSEDPPGYMDVSDNKQPTWTTHLSEWNTLTNELGYDTNNVVCIAVRNNPSYVGPSDSPIEIIGKSESSSGQDYKDIIDSKFNPEPGQKIHIFIDVSGSMDRNTIEPGIDDFETLLSNDNVEYIEYHCDNERWLKWFINIINGDEGGCS